MSDYGYRKTLSFSFEEAIPKIKEALKSQGFGVLTEINVKAAMKKKLGLDMDEYLILGACNPKLAYQALAEEVEIGLLLPCNVIVYQKEGSVVVSAIRPDVGMSFVDNDSLEGIAKQAGEALQFAIDSI